MHTLNDMCIYYGLLDVKTEKQQRILKMLSQKGIIRPRDLKKYGISPQILYRLQRDDMAVRLSRGIYANKDYQPTEYHGIVQVCSKLPKSVICLLSALQFHDLTTQLPHEVWIAVERPRRPVNIDAPVHVVYFSQESFQNGIEIHNIEGIEVKVYCPAKTVADCFKYRNKIGLDVALEALKDCLSQKKCLVDDIWKYARICRVANVIKPYLEAVV